VFLGCNGVCGYAGLHLPEMVRLHKILHTLGYFGATRPPVSAS
jgi:hypothetical protein